MNKLLPVLIFLAIFLTPLYPVYAEEATPTATVKPGSAFEHLKMVRKEPVGTVKTGSGSARLKQLTDQLKTKLQGFKDQKKATLVERINNDLGIVNERRTTQMTAVLDILSKIVEKIETKLASSTASEADKQKINTEIAATKVSIETAKAAVASQSAKQYTIQVSSESAVRADAKKSRDLLHQDLLSTHQQVKEARQSVVDLIQSFRAANQGGASGN